jgi:hypothetical protein
MDAKEMKFSTTVSMPLSLIERLNEMPKRKKSRFVVDAVLKALDAKNEKTPATE